MTPANTWVDAYTTRTGMPDPRLAGTLAKPHHCRHCARLLLVGYDSPTLADLATVDPYVLTPALEAAAVILARPTWQLWGPPGRYQLTARTPVRITGLALIPADRCVVVATHHCGRPPLTHTPLPTRAPAWVADSDGPPPF
jgi:hypothetical protein